MAKGQEAWADLESLFEDAAASPIPGSTLPLREIEPDPEPAPQDL